VKRLIFFTNTYPYGLGEQWKSNELKVFEGHFDQITIVPLHYGNNKKPLSLGATISSYKPLFDPLPTKMSWADRLGVFRGPTLYLLKEFWRSKAYQSRAHFNNWNNSAVLLTKMLRHSTVQDLMKEDLSQAVFYFYWGIRACDLLPFFKRKFPEARYFVRFHGFDLYESRNRGYIPFRLPVLRELDAAIAISAYGKNYLESKYGGQLGFDVVLNRLGVPFTGQSEASSDGVLRIVSCASLIPLKRVELIYRALLLVDVSVEWTHIGDGVLMEPLQQLIKDQPKSNIKVDLRGKCTPDEVVATYAKNPFDVFVHVSETEGVPVVVMEALAAGIPVLATDAGGTAELVNEGCGKVLPVALSPEKLAEELIAFNRLPEANKEKMRSEALNQYKKHCNAESNAEELVKLLTEMR
jgi:glycosyltransferase involved in cell wall biosynthesis